MRRFFAGSPDTCWPTDERIGEGVAVFEAVHGSAPDIAGRNRLHHWRIAYGSAREVDTHLRLLMGTGSIEGSRADEALLLFDDVRAITWRLLHPKA